MLVFLNNDFLRYLKTYVYLNINNKLTTNCRSPLLSDDNISNNESTPRVISSESSNRPSPEILPNYGKLLKNILEKKVKNCVGVWNNKKWIKSINYL